MAKIPIMQCLDAFDDLFEYSFSCVFFDSGQGLLLDEFIERAISEELHNDENLGERLKILRNF
jgi:hypothetical protein